MQIQLSKQRHHTLIEFQPPMANICMCTVQYTLIEQSCCIAVRDFNIKDL